MLALGVGRRPLSQIGLEPLEDLPPLQIEQAEADRSRRPVCCDCFEDRAGGVCGLNFGFSENGRAIGGMTVSGSTPGQKRSANWSCLCWLKSNVNVVISPPGCGMLLKYQSAWKKTVLVAGPWVNVVNARVASPLP